MEPIQPITLSVFLITDHVCSTGANVFAGVCDTVRRAAGGQVRWSMDQGVSGQMDRGLGDHVGRLGGDQMGGPDR